MEVEELCRKLKPVIGRKAEALWLAYLSAEKFEEKREIEMTLNLLAARYLNERVDNKRILLTPPPKDIVSGEYTLGSVIYNGKEIYPFGLRESEWVQHVSILGRSGAGKTNTCFNIIKVLLEHKKPFLIFDWKRNYRDILNLYPDHEFLIYTVGRNISPIQFNPLIPPEQTAPDTWLKKLIEIIATTYYVGEGVISLLTRAIDAVYKKYGVYEGNAECYPTMRDVLRWLEDYPARGREAQWMVSTLRSVRALCYGEMSRVINVDQQMGIEKLLRKNVILELDALTNTDKTFLIETLLLWIHHYRLAEGKREEFKHTIIIEEAHHILRRQEHSKNEHITETILREIRELGESIIILDQMPSLLTPLAMANTQCTITMNLKNKSCVFTAAGYTLLDREEKDYFGQLPIGYAIVKLQDRWSSPFLIKIPLIPIKKGSVTDEMVRRVMARYSANSSSEKPVQSHQQPIPAVPKTNELTDIEKEFLIQVYKYPLNGTVQKYRRIALSRRKGNLIKQNLIKKGLIISKPILTKNGTFMLMELTDKGKEILKNHGYKITNNPNEGGAEHRYWINKIASWYKSNGYGVEIEKKIGNGGACDIEITDNNGEKFAIEVQTTEANLKNNIQKNIKAGYKKIIIFATNDKARGKIKEILLEEVDIPKTAEIELMDWGSSPV